MAVMIKYITFIAGMGILAVLIIGEWLSNKII